jgi:hypothetical protein
MSDSDSSKQNLQTAEEKARRKIPGNLPYMSAYGNLKRTLDKIPTAEKPSTFSLDFLGTVLGLTGGSARPVIPILKSANLLGKDGVPTDLYAQFQTDGGRSAAALEALRNAYGEIFRRNQYADQASERELLDLVVAITGLPKADAVVRQIVGTFQIIKSFVQPGTLRQPGPAPAPIGLGSSIGTNAPDDTGADTDHQPAASRRGKPVQLVYNINIVLPETTNMEVYNVIFKSIKGNLLN